MGDPAQPPTSLTPEMAPNPSVLGLRPRNLDEVVTRPINKCWTRNVYSQVKMSPKQVVRRVT